MNLFSGRISQKWLELYEETMLEPRTEEEQKYFKHYNRYIWGTAVVEKILRTQIELWETRNQEIHGKEDESSNQRHERLQEKVRNLHTMENKVKPRDKYLFRPDLNNFLTKAKTSTLATYVSSHTRAIHTSVKQWKSEQKIGVQSVYRWLTRHSRQNKAKIERLYKKDREQMLDGRQKEKRRRQRRRHDQSTLPSVRGYFSLARTH